MVDVGKRESAANRKRKDEYEELMGHFSDPGLPVGTSLILAALGSCALLDAGSKQKKKAAGNKRLVRPSKNDCVGKPGGPWRPLANGCPGVPAEVA